VFNLLYIKNNSLDLYNFLFYNSFNIAL